jgi:branched-chain amino acid aminotransferase
MAMRVLREAVFLQAVGELVKIDSAWIPKGDGGLYLPPVIS